MTIRFKCPDCGRPFQLPDDAAGKRVNCADCRAIDVPVMGSVVRFVGRIFGDGLASSPILLGRFALFFCWVPILGVMMGAPLGLLGITLGVLGLPVGVFRTREAMIRSLGGIGMCLLAILGSFVSTGILIVYLKNAADRGGPRPQQVTTTGLPTFAARRDNLIALSAAIAERATKAHLGPGLKWLDSGSPRQPQRVASPAIYSGFLRWQLTRLFLD